MARISSAAHVTAVLQFLQAFNRHDLAACEQMLDARVEWHSAVAYNGRAEVLAMLEGLGESFADVQARPDDFKVADNHVLMIVCLHEGDADASARQQRQSWIAQMGDDGLIKRVLAYPTPADAGRAFEELAAAAHKVHA